MLVVVCSPASLLFSCKVVAFSRAPAPTGGAEPSPSGRVWRVPSDRGLRTRTPDCAHQRSRRSWSALHKRAVEAIGVRSVPVQVARDRCGFRSGRLRPLRDCSKHAAIFCFGMSRGWGTLGRSDRRGALAWLPVQPCSRAWAACSARPRLRYAREHRSA